MIVRTYGRRTRSLGRDGAATTDPDADVILLDDSDDYASASDAPLSQGTSQDPFAFSSQDSFAFSSQDSYWSLDSFDDGAPSIVTDSGSRRARKRGRPAPAAGPTATLMEAQEFGEMMEHVDEVNFALDGLRPGQPARIRRASLLSLLSICATPTQRRLFRAQGMAKRIIDAIFGLSFDDSPSTVAAAALFYVLTSDAQDDHLLDSPLCIQFLLKLLNPPKVNTAEDKAPTMRSKLIGIRKPQVLTSMSRELDSTSKAINSKVHEILLSCKEIKLGKDDDFESERPEVSSKWISLLTMEKACLSTVSFEDTTNPVRSVGGHFKERLRDLGGLDAVFDVVANCHSTIEVLKRNSHLSSDLKDGVLLQGVVLLLKCLKIMENATFLSKENQNHLLGMRTKLDFKQPDIPFVAVIINTIKFLSDLSLIQPAENSSCLPKAVDPYCFGAPKAQCKDMHKDNQWLSSAQSETSVLELEMTEYGSDTSKKKASQLFSGIHSRVSNCQNDKAHRKSNGSKLSVRGSNGWLSIKVNGSSKELDALSKRPRTCVDVSDDHMNDWSDPFTFDEHEVEPSKWELLATSKKQTSSTRLKRTTSKLAEKCQALTITANHDLTQSNDGDNIHSTDDNDPPQERSLTPTAEEEPTLLENCLIAAIKVLMNLTNDNPLGCQQIAACDGLSTMASLIIKHFPSFDLHTVAMQSEQNVSSSDQSIEAGHLKREQLSDHKLDFLVAILGLLVNLVEKDSQNRSRLASARVSLDEPEKSGAEQTHMDVIPLLCSIFLANQGAGELAGEGEISLCDGGDSLLEGEREAERMIVEAYAALLLAFLSTESTKVREAIASHLPNQNLRVLVPVLERFVAFHLTLNMISPETHSAVSEVIESCRQP